VSLGDLLPDRPSLRLSEADVLAVRHGRDVEARGVDWSGQASAENIVVRLLAPDGSLVALAVPGREAGVLHPSVVLG